MPEAARGVLLLRLVVRLEPLAFEKSPSALAERRVMVVQGADGMGYVTGEVCATDAVAIDGMLAAAARDFGADDPRNEQQRRSDLFADLLLGRLASPTQTRTRPSTVRWSRTPPDSDEQQEWLEVEDIDPDTGELLGTHFQAIDPEGEAIGDGLIQRPNWRNDSLPHSLSNHVRFGSASSCRCPPCSV